MLEEIAMELPRLSVINEQFAIRSILGEVGPFEATYLAWDLENEEQVVLREFLPVKFVDRVAPGTEIRSKNSQYDSFINYGKKRFEKELAILADLTHPNIVRTRLYFSENNTLYGVYDYHPGASLEDILLQHNGKVSAKTAITILMPFIDAVRAGHKAGLIHGAISPRKLYLSKTGRPMVLSFKTTHLLLAARAKVLHTIQQAGFSPPEQYTPRGKHGPWSDIYSCAATLYTMLSGHILPDISQRSQQDVVPQLLAESPDIPDQIQGILESALSLDIGDRPKSLDQFQELLTESLSMPAQPAAPASDQETVHRPYKTPEAFHDVPSHEPPQEDSANLNAPVQEPPSTSVFDEEATIPSPSMFDKTDSKKSWLTASESQSYSNNFQLLDPYESQNGTHPVEPSHTEAPIKDDGIFNDSFGLNTNSNTTGKSLLSPNGAGSSLVASSPSSVLSPESSNLTEDAPIKKPKSYQKIDPETAYDYNVRRKRRSKVNTSFVFIAIILSGSLIALAYVIYTRFQTPGTEAYQFDETAYQTIVARGDSLYELAFDVSATANPERSIEIFDDALENYLAAQSLYRDDAIVRNRIKTIRQHLEEQPQNEDPLDEKATLASISTGDSLMRIADFHIQQGDSVRASALFSEARSKYLAVFEKFPNDSLTAARLRLVSERMTAPSREIKRPAPRPTPPPPSAEQIRNQLYLTFKAQGDSALARRDFDEARRKYIEALEQKPGDPEATQQLQLTERQIRDTQRYGQFSQHISAGKKLKEAGRLSDARREFELASQILPNDQEAKQAIFEIDSILEEQSRRQENYLSHRTRGDVLLEQKRYEEALESYEAALVSKPGDTYAQIKIDETKKDIESLSEVTEELPQGMVDSNGIYNFTEEAPVLIGGTDILQTRLRYPARAREAGIEGRVTVRMVVDEKGELSNPTIIKGLGYGCDEEVLRVIRGARFEPGTVGGAPVASWHTLYFEFTM